MIDAGVDLGLNLRPRAARRQTAFGAATMLLMGRVRPGDLRDNVTSPGGTTAAAAGAIDAHDVPGGIRCCVDCCSAAFGAARGGVVACGVRFAGLAAPHRVRLASKGEWTDGVRVG